MPKDDLEHLTPAEQEAVLEFVHLLQEQLNRQVRSVLLFGSKARGEDSLDSDLDVLVVVDSDDWRVHKQIRYLAADICLEYSLDLSPRIWSTAYRQVVEELQTLLYQNIRRDGINLLATSFPTD